MTEEIITAGEKFYCLIQDIEEYIQHNSLEQDKELDFILSQSEELQSDYARLEQENKELKAYKDVNEDFKKDWDELNKKYTEVLKLAKENADSNEYCLQELERENKELKETVKDLNQSIQNCNIQRTKMYKALEEIRATLNKECGIISNAKVVGIINEVLGNENN